jgi:DNA-binding transcriptional LysR family regulator
MLVITRANEAEMDLRRVQVFVTAAKSKSFTEAGKRLHLTQSAVSQQIRLLEQEIGEPLFQRNNQTVRLAAGGERLLPIAEQALTAWYDFDARARRRDSIVGRLAIGASGAAKAYLWAAIYNEFGRRYPAVTLDLKTTESTQNSIDRVRSGDLDVALAVAREDEVGLEVRPLGVHEAVLCTAISHPLARRRNLAPPDFAEERFLLFEKPVSIRWLSDEFFQRTGITPKVVLESNDVHLIRSMIEVGYGIGFLPDWAIQRELQEKRLAAIKPMGQPLRQRFGLVYDPHALSPAARAFVDFCVHNKHLLPVSARVES